MGYNVLIPGFSKLPSPSSFISCIAGEGASGKFSFSFPLSLCPALPPNASLPSLPLPLPLTPALLPLLLILAACPVTSLALALSLSLLLSLTRSLASLLSLLLLSPFTFSSLLSLTASWPAAGGRPFGLPPWPVMVVVPCRAATMPSPRRRPDTPSGRLSHGSRRLPGAECRRGRRPAGRPGRSRES